MSTDYKTLESVFLNHIFKQSVRVFGGKNQRGASLAASEHLPTTYHRHSIFKMKVIIGIYFDGYFYFLHHYLFSFHLHLITSYYMEIQGFESLVILFYGLQDFILFYGLR